MAGGLSVTEVKDMQDLFNELDKDKTGEIEGSELKDLLKRLNIDEGNADLLDTNGSGSVSFDEFLEGFNSKMKPPSADALKAAFQSSDANGDGYLDLAELKDTMKSMNQPCSDKIIQYIMAATDKNTDGKISYEEFGSMLKA